MLKTLEAEMSRLTALHQRAQLRAERSEAEAGRYEPVAEAISAAIVAFEGAVRALGGNVAEVYVMQGPAP